MMMLLHRHSRMWLWMQLEQKREDERRRQPVPQTPHSTRQAFQHHQETCSGFCSNVHRRPMDFVGCVDAIVRRQLV